MANIALSGLDTGQQPLLLLGYGAQGRLVFKHPFNRHGLRPAARPNGWASASAATNHCAGGCCSAHAIMQHAALDERDGSVDGGADAAALCQYRGLRAGQQAGTGGRAIPAKGGEYRPSPAP